MPQHTIDNPPIPIIPTLSEEEITRVTVNHRYNAGTNDNRDMARVTSELPVADRPNVELIIHVINEFIDATDDNRLHLDTGASKFAKFREVLKGTPRNRWDAELAGNAGRTNDDFTARLAGFVARFVGPEGLLVQEQYMLTKVVKKRQQTVEELNDRIDVIETCARRFPGAPANLAEVWNESKRKNMLFNMMLDTWKRDYMKAGFLWHNADVTRASIVGYMTTQMNELNDAQAARRNRAQYNRNTNNQNFNQASNRSYSNQRNSPYPQQQLRSNRPMPAQSPFQGRAYRGGRTPTPQRSPPGRGQQGRGQTYQPRRLGFAATPRPTRGGGTPFRAPQRPIGGRGQFYQDQHYQQEDTQEYYPEDDDTQEYYQQEESNDVEDVHYQCNHNYDQNCETQSAEHEDQQCDYDQCDDQQCDY